MIKTIIFLTKIAVATAIALLFTSCNHSINFGDGVQGNGNVTTQARTITESFKSIEASHGINVIVEQSDDKSVTVETDDNLQSIIVTRVENGVLIVEAKKGYNADFTPKVTVKMPEIIGLSTSSGANINSNNTLITDNIAVKSNSGSEINIQVEADHITVENSSGSETTVSGKALNLETTASSGSSIDAERLAANVVSAQATSGSSTSIDAIVSLNGKASSGASITYKKAPKTNLVKEENSGGSVSQE
ncbi:MAG: DUF2807 domain-containing protein [Flavobacterium sp.]|nr:DUF2807 domain-containing protein [Flavobacterium sp.]